MKEFRLALILFFVVAASATATVCIDIANPCKEKSACIESSDFVFEAKLAGIHEREIIDRGDGMKTPEIVKHKNAQLNISNWVKGKPNHDPTIIEFDMDQWYCSMIKPIMPKLEVGKKYTVHGVYHRSKNFCKITSSSADEIKSCTDGPRTEMRFYLLFDEIVK